MADLVSVYMPTRNRVKMLRAAIRSVLEQSYPRIELVVVDDGSTDGTGAYLDELARSDPRVCVITHAASMGACVSRNAAITAAKGRFIVGLDDDDEFLPTMVEDLLAHWRFLEGRGDTPSGLYVQDRYRGGKYAETNKSGAIDADDLFDGNGVGNQIFSLRERYLAVGMFDPQMPAWQDLEFIYRLLSRYGRARLLDLPLYVFDVSDRPDRISHQSITKIMQACDRMYQLHGGGISRQKQRLLLQVHSSFYGFPVGLRKLLSFMRLGFWPRGYAAMIARYIGKPHWE